VTDNQIGAAHPLERRRQRLLVAIDVERVDLICPHFYATVVYKPLAALSRASASRPSRPT
jgi:hypothetical protein